MRNRWKRFDSDDREAGFTLIELMVVVLIIAILIAIAIPTFLGARAKAQDRAAQSNLRNALTSAQIYYTNGSTYTGIDAAGLQVLEPSIKFIDALPSPPGKEVQVKSDGASLICLSTHSDSGTDYTIIDAKAPDGATTPGTYFAKSIPATCDGDAVASVGAVTTGF
jgi:type IV pilus assembly protein PilA